MTPEERKALERAEGNVAPRSAHSRILTSDLQWLIAQAHEAERLRASVGGFRGQSVERLEHEVSRGDVETLVEQNARMQRTLRFLAGKLDWSKPELDAYARRHEGGKSV